jgi:hypothetical protein
LGDPNLPSGLLEHGEEVRSHAVAGDSTLLVTDRRLAVWLGGDGFELDIPFDALRRIQFDIERVRPATLVIVPEHPSDLPVVLAVPPEDYDGVSAAIMIVAAQLVDVPVPARDRVSAERAD